MQCAELLQLSNDVNRGGNSHWTRSWSGKRWRRREALRLLLCVHLLLQFLLLHGLMLGSSIVLALRDCAAHRGSGSRDDRSTCGHPEQPRTSASS